jgi:hypothetical protein
MAKKLVLSAVTAVLAVCVIGAGSASAATEFGDTCTATAASGESLSATLFDITSPANPLPLAAPSAGVVTSWKMSLSVPEEVVPRIIPQTLKVLRLDTGAKTALVVGEASGLIGSGPNVIPARIPIQTGDRLGLFGSGPVTFEGSTSEVGTLYCGEQGDAAIGAIIGGPPPGATAPYSELPEVSEVRIPGTAVIEPDADGDGFGDETQDLCPQSALSQTACPVVTLSASASAGKKLATVLVTADQPATVGVTGKASLGKGKKAKLKAKAKAVSPGTLTKFKLKFSSALKKRLKELTPKQFVTLKVAVSAPNVVGKPTQKKIKLKLKGQG